VNNTATLKNRFNNRLNKSQQKKVRKQVIIARIMGLLPIQGFIETHHKRNLRTLQEDVEDSV